MLLFFFLHGKLSFSNYFNKKYVGFVKEISWSFDLYDLILESLFVFMIQSEDSFLCLISPDLNSELDKEQTDLLPGHYYTSSVAYYKNFCLNLEQLYLKILR